MRDSTRVRARCVCAVSGGARACRTLPSRNPVVARGTRRCAAVRRRSGSPPFTATGATLPLGMCPRALASAQAPNPDRCKVEPCRTVSTVELGKWSRFRSAAGLCRATEARARRSIGAGPRDAVVHRCGFRAGETRGGKKGGGVRQKRGVGSGKGGGAGRAWQWRRTAPFEHSTLLGIVADMARGKNPWGLTRGRGRERAGFSAHKSLKREACRGRG